MMLTHQCSAIDISTKKDDQNYSQRCLIYGVVFLNSLLLGSVAWTSGPVTTSTTRVLLTCTCKRKPKKHIEEHCLSFRRWKMSDSAQSKNAITWFWKQFVTMQIQRFGMSSGLVTIRKTISWVTIEEQQWGIITMDDLVLQDSSGWKVIVDQKTSAT